MTEAEATYRKAIELAEEERRATAYSLLANFFYSRERFEEAEAVLREGVEAEGDNLELIYGLARFYHARGETEKADTMIAEATMADPENPQPYLLLSAYRGRQGDLEGALEAAEAALARLQTIFAPSSARRSSWWISATEETTARGSPRGGRSSTPCWPVTRRIPRPSS